MRVPPTQNIRFLIKYHTSPDQFASRPAAGATAPECVDGHYEWEVEDVVAHKTTRSGMRYLVKWKGFSRKQWLPEANMENSKDLLREYHRRTALPLTPFLEQGDDQGEGEIPLSPLPNVEERRPVPPSPLRNPDSRAATPTGTGTAPPTPTLPEPGQPPTNARPLPRRSPRLAEI